MTPGLSPRIDHAPWLKLAALSLLLVLLVQIGAEYALGRIWICACGTVKLWEGEVYSEGNSQHIFDWYSFSHVAHGFLFYGLGYLLLRNRRPALAFALALVIEAGWEILENSPIIIERYRAETISLDYFGDSILNSTVDTLAMVLGYCLAARLPVLASVLIVLAMELVVGYLIRDNLTLNVLMLVWPLEGVKAWQSEIAPAGL